jgi:hypothetical protein
LGGSGAERVSSSAVLELGLEVVERLLGLLDRDVAALHERSV